MSELNPETLWHDCLESIKVSVSPAVFSTWFSQTHLTNFKQGKDRGEAEIGCPSSYIKTTIENRYFGLIQDCLKKALETPCSLSFVVKDNPRLEANPSETEAPLFGESDNNSSYHNAVAYSRLRPNFVFSNFAVSPSNQMAWAAAEAVANTPGEAYNPLFIWGGVGVGKTHLMSAVGHEILKKDTAKKVYFCTGEEFTNDIVEGIRNKSTPGFRNKYRRLEALLIDDIQFIAGKESVQEEFFHTFNAIVGSGGQVILTSDRPPQDIAKLEERLRSRFEAGLIVDIAPPDFELRCAIIQIKAKEKGLDLPMNIVQMIAGNQDSARKIQGFLVRLSSELNLKKGVEINEDLIQSLLGKKLENNGFLKRVEPETVMELICKHYSLGKRQLLSDSRLQKFALPRQVLMYLLRVELKLQLAEVGRIVANRDHTTVMHAVDKISHLASNNVNIRGDIDEIKKLIWG